MTLFFTVEEITITILSVKVGMQGLFLSLNKKNQWDDFKHTTTFGRCVLTFPGEQKVLLDDFPSECEQKIASTTT